MDFNKFKTWIFANMVIFSSIKGFLGSSRRKSNTLFYLPLFHLPVEIYKNQILVNFLYMCLLTGDANQLMGLQTCLKSHIMSCI